MPIARKFFDWHLPALPQVVDWLIADRGARLPLDLSEVLLVVPGRRAGRRLEELLFERTNGRFAPPRIVTLGELPEELYDAQHEFASDLTQRLAWASVLGGLPRASLEVLLRNVPDRDDFDAWLALGTMLARHHSELAADGLDFGDVAAHGSELPGFDEHERWRVLHDVQQRYLQLLDGLNLWDKQTARLFAIKHRECRTDKQILLLATVDINRAPRRMLDQVADRVTALIHAPEVLAERFDEHGCLRPETWSAEQFELAPERVRVVDGPADEAAETAYVIAEFGGAYRADQITIGIADNSLIPHLRRQLRECGLAARPVIERQLHQTAPATLLAAVADYVADDRSGEFAILVRHPDVSAWLAAQQVAPGWLNQLDGYLSSHLQPRLGEWLGPARDFVHLQQTHAAVRRLVAPLIAPPRPLHEWSSPIGDLLAEVYGHVEFDEESPGQRLTLAACRELQAALADQQQTPAALGAAFTSAQAIRLALDAVETAVVPPPPDPAAIPLLGWLELPLDDAPAAIVTTFNEGFVPESLNSDLFLPNRLRQRLGVLDNARRYARDAYALNVLLHSRETVTLVVGRRTADGDPLKPSRLLFATDPAAIARRVLQFYGDEARTAQASRPPLPSSLVAAREAPEFFIPRPAPLLNPPERIRVTAFKTYLACPYRYYLNFVLGLGAADDSIEELSGSAFGDLMHKVLREFGRSTLVASQAADAVREFLDDSLAKFAREMLGAVRQPAVQLQLEQLRRRLHAFAAYQVENVELGWETQFTEIDPTDDDPVLLELEDGRSIALSGRIDRIDYNRRTDTWRIIDYKSEAKGKTPNEVHRRSDEWIDLQLPLYRHLARRLGVTGQVELAYFLLPDNSERCRIEVADWTVAELDDADQLARRVARDILDEKFWPPSDKVQYDDWSAICQVNAFDGEVLEEET